MRAHSKRRRPQLHHPNSKTKSSNGGEDSRNKRVMANLKDSIISRVGPTVDSSDLERRLNEVFPRGFDSPMHPPYALMIRTAILDLNEDNGSTEEAISEFIKLKFHDLPFAHSRILRFQLEKLCLGQELALAENGTYVLLEDSPVVAEVTTATKPRKGKKKNKKKSGSAKVQDLPKSVPVTEIVIELSSSSSLQEQVQQHPNINQSEKKNFRVYQRRQGGDHEVEPVKAKPPACGSGQVSESGVGDRPEPLKRRPRERKPVRRGY